MSEEAAASGQAVLLVANPSGHSKRVPLSTVPFSIGRQSDNDVVIRDNRSSRQHARIVVEAGDYYIEDLKSRHGIYVNDEKVERHRLTGGDVITFGVEDSYQLTFHQEEGELNRLLGQFPTPSKLASAGAANLAKLRSMIEVARALQSSLTTEEVLDAVVDAALTVTSCERGFLLMRTEEDLNIRVARDQHGTPIPKDDLRVPTSVISRALSERRELLSMNFDPTAEQDVRPEGTVARLELRSVVCVPLVRVRTGDQQETVHTSLNDTVGLIYLDSKLDVADLSGGNRELLQSLAIEASTVLENARLLEEERAKLKLEEELDIARTIQQYLLPKELPTTGWFRAAGSSIASKAVGGDYFDAIQISPDRWSTMVADVSGKGVSSALMAALLQGAFLRAAEGPDQVQEMLERMNRFMLERTEGEKYATLFYSILNIDGEFIWTNAAHVAPILVRRDGSIALLQPSGMPVGLLEAATFEVNTDRLLPGDRLVICSDGFTEAQNAAGEYFEVKRMRKAVASIPEASCTELHDLLLQEMETFAEGTEQADDVTLVVIEYHPE